MKSYTDLEQSRKLAEFLPLESADMQWFLEEDYGIVQIKEGLQDWGGDCTIPCWSLAALLGVFPMVVGRDLDMYCCWQNSKNLHSKHYDNPVDACYEMIIKLHERKIL